MIQGHTGKERNKSHLLITDSKKEAAHAVVICGVKTSDSNSKKLSVILFFLCHFFVVFLKKPFPSLFFSIKSAVQIMANLKVLYYTLSALFILGSTEASSHG